MARKETEPVNTDSSPVTESSRAGSIVQAIILLTTVYLAVLKYMATENDTALFVSLISTAVVFGIYALIRYRGKESRNDVKVHEYQRSGLPSFNMVYVLYLPFMICLLFKRELVPVHCAMALNIVDIPLVVRIPIQIAVLLFNFGNSSMVTTGLVGIFINVLLCSALEQVSELKSLDEVDCNLFSMLLTDILYLIRSDTLQFSVLRSCLMGFLTAVSVNYLISSKLKQVHPLLRSLVLLSSFAFIFPGVILLSLDISVEENAFVWLFHYILQSKPRMMMLACWLVSLLILIPNVFYFKSSMSLNMSRKVWHFALLPLLIPQMVMDAEFTTIAVAGTSVLFLIVEYFRYMELAPIGSYFNSQLRYFTDYRDDKGPIIISYIYLIIGVSLPLLVGNSLVGIISLGVGDSLASIVGKNFGTHRWPGSKKTLEGTAAFIVATSICSILCQSYFKSFVNISNRNIIAVSVLSGILEGNSNLNDNILIPAFLMISMELSKYY